MLLASVSLLFLLLIAVAILHCIVRRRQRETSSNWTSRRSLCLITPQGAKGAEQVYVLELSAASARDVEKAIQSSLGSQCAHISPFSSGPQPVPLVALRSGTPEPMQLDASVPVYPSNEKADAQRPGKILTTSDSPIFSYLCKLGITAFHANSKYSLVE